MSGALNIFELADATVREGHEGHGNVTAVDKVDKKKD